MGRVCEQLEAVAARSGASLSYLVWSSNVPGCEGVVEDFSYSWNDGQQQLTEQAQVHLYLVVRDGHGHQVARPFDLLLAGLATPPEPTAPAAT